MNGARLIATLSMVALGFFIIGWRLGQLGAAPLPERSETLVHYSDTSATVEIVNIGDVRCAVLLTTHGDGSLDCSLDKPQTLAAADMPIEESEWPEVSP